MRQGKVTHRERLLETATEKWKIAEKHAGEPVRRWNSAFCIKARLTVPKLFFFLIFMYNNSKHKMANILALFNILSI